MATLPSMYVTRRTERGTERIEGRRDGRGNKKKGCRGKMEFVSK
jgi:hypothetical protein